MKIELLNLESVRFLTTFTFEFFVPFSGLYVHMKVFFFPNCYGRRERQKWAKKTLVGEKLCFSSSKEAKNDHKILVPTLLKIIIN